MTHLLKYNYFTVFLITILEYPNFMTFFLQQVQFKSSLMDDYLFKVVNGDVEVVQPPFRTTFDKFGKPIQKLKEKGIQIPGRNQNPPFSEKPRANFPSSGLM